MTDLIAWGLVAHGAGALAAERIRRRQRFSWIWLPGWLIDPRRRCPHLRQRGIYGDEIIAAGFRRARCLDCGRLLPSLPPEGAQA